MARKVGVCLSRVVLVLVLFTSVVNASVVTYEADVFPEDTGWERVGTFDAERWIDDGWFYQHAELGAWKGEIGETDFYQRSLADFAGAEEFFIEWRVQTDVPSSLFDHANIATVLSAAGTGYAYYHFTITDERVRLLRRSSVPIVFADIQAGVPHAYRLEVYGEDLYAWYIDGQLIDSGVPVAAYPTAGSVLVWGARHNVYDNNTRWDYIRYGVIPEPGTGLLLLLSSFALIARRYRSHC